MVGPTGFEPATLAPRHSTQAVFIGLRGKFLLDLHLNLTACFANVLFFHPKVLSIAETPDRLLSKIVRTTELWIKCDSNFFPVADLAFGLIVRA